MSENEKSVKQNDLVLLLERILSVLGEDYRKNLRELADYSEE